MHQYRRQPGLDYKTITALAGRLAAQLLRNANAVLMASNDVVRNNGIYLTATEPLTKHIKHN